MSFIHERSIFLESENLLRNRYLAIKELGKGNNITYLAKDTKKNGELRAIKEIKSISDLNRQEMRLKIRERFDLEAESLKRLGKHPQIPKLFDRFEYNEKFYLVQEYIEGENLGKEEIVSGKKRVEREVLELLQEILNILQFVHKNDLIHRDIKPSNLIRRNDGKLFLIDFGVAKKLDDLNEEWRSTMICGTPGYMSPEQINGNPKKYSDIYAVGIIAIQALTGYEVRELFSCKNSDYLVWNYSLHNREKLQVSNGLENILNKMTCRKWEDRYQSVEEILYDLKNLSRIQTKPLICRKVKQNKWVRSGIIASSLFIGIIIGNISPSIWTEKEEETPRSNELPLVQKMGDRISQGEEVLSQDSDLKNLELKQKAANYYRKDNYTDAIALLRNAWDKSADPETLIALNNALLKETDSKYYTIAVVVPFTSSLSQKNVKNVNLAKELLRGVAQAQLEINAALLPKHPQLPNKELKKKSINGKGLKIIIADDANNIKKAQEIALELTKESVIIGAIGHYASDITKETLDIYERNAMTLISPGSTSEYLSEPHRHFFFRTIPNIGLSSERLANHLIEKSIYKTAIFYNPTSPYTKSFWEEFKNRFEGKGGKVVSSIDTLHENNFNARKTLDRIKKDDKTALVLFPDGQVTNAVSNALEIIEINKGENWIVGGATLYNPTILSLGNAAMFEKFALVVPWHPLSSPNLEFSKDSKHLWRANTNHRTALAYDAAKAFIRAIELQNRPTKIGTQEKLSARDFYAQGAIGTIKFDRSDRKNPFIELVTILSCNNNTKNLAFVPIDRHSCKN